MKRYVLACVSVIEIALLVGLAAAQPPDGPGQERGRPPAPPGRPVPPPLMTAIDADNDGEISAEELENVVAALKKLDTDGDGKLGREELRPRPGSVRGRGEFGGAGGPTFGAPDARSFVDRLMRFDENGDGKVTRDELPEFMRRLLERTDSNQDGAIDKEEAEGMAERMGRGGPGMSFPGGGVRSGPGGEGFFERLLSFDKNGDGKLSTDELPEPMRDRLFDRADANKDGVVDGEELKKMRERLRPGGPGPGSTADDVFLNRFMSFDKDGDGKVTASELPEPMRRIVEQADANEDGGVDRAEVKKMRGGEPGMWDPGAPQREEDEGAETASHEEKDSLPIEFAALSCLRLRADGNLLAGDSESEQIKVISPAGELVATIEPGFGPEAMNVSVDGTIYCGGDGRLAKISADGQVLKTVEAPANTKSETTRRRASSRPVAVSGIAIFDDAVFVAFGSGWSLGSKSKLFRFDLDLENPQLLAEGLRGCCQHCDISARDNVLYLAENSAHRVVLYDRDGEVLNKWGSKSRQDLEGFGSCCNPMNLAFDASGTLYTAESGLGRVKRYTPNGEFIGLVGYLDIERFTRGGLIAASCCNMPIAVTAQGKRVYIMDVKDNLIRVLEKKGPSGASEE